MISSPAEARALGIAAVDQDIQLFPELDVGALVGVVNGLVATVFEVPSFIGTLGMMVILRGLALDWTNGGIISGLPSAFDNIASARFLGLDYIVWLMVLVFVVLYTVLKQTTFGLQVFAVGGNPEATRLAGIPVKRVRFLTFALSGPTGPIERRDRLGGVLHEYSRAA